MLDLLPRRAFFRFEIPLHYCAAAPPLDANIAKWDPRYLLPPLVELEDQRPFADVYCSWSEDGLRLAVDVPGRRGPFRCDPRQWWKGDGLRICVDTRDTRDAKRATRFCHFFYVLPAGDGKRPLAGLHRMSRAKEPPPAVDASRLRLAVHADRHGYAVEVAIPAGCLHGWNPAEQQRIGLFYKIKDVYQGAQHLTVNDELGWNVDPSTWATGLLLR